MASTRYFDPLVINPGKLRHRVQIQAQSKAPDATTGQPPTGDAGWSTLRTTWASVDYIPAGSREAFQSGQFTGMAMYKIAIRWTSDVISVGMRVVFGTHTYLIQNVDNVSLQGVAVNFMCVELDGKST